MLAIQFEASHADTNNEPDQERQTIASGVLLFLGDVRFPTGEDGPLNLVKIPGGGWCFYDAVARKLVCGGMGLRYFSLHRSACTVYTEG